MAQVAPLLEELRQQNEVQMQMFKTQMEEEFKRKMQLVMLNLNTGKTAPSTATATREVVSTRTSTVPIKSRYESPPQHQQQQQQQQQQQLKNIKSAPALYQAEQGAVDVPPLQGLRAGHPASSGSKLPNLPSQSPPRAGAGGVGLGDDDTSLGSEEDEAAVMWRERQESIKLETKPKPKPKDRSSSSSDHKMDSRNQYVYNKTAYLIGETRKVSKKSKKQQARRAKRAQQELEEGRGRQQEGSLRSLVGDGGGEDEDEDEDGDYVAFKPTTAYNDGFSAPTTAMARSAAGPRNFTGGRVGTASVGANPRTGSAVVQFTGVASDEGFNSRFNQSGSGSGASGERQGEGQAQAQGGDAEAGGLAAGVSHTRLTRKVSFSDEFMPSAESQSQSLLPHILTPGTAGSSSSSSSRASKRFVNTADLAVQEDRTHLQWQDDIARHVLTMFATSKIRRPALSAKQKTSSMNLLSFIDVKHKTEGLGDTNGDIYMDGSNVGSPHRTAAPLPQYKDIDFPDIIAKQLPPDPVPPFEATNNNVPFSGTNVVDMDMGVSGTFEGMGGDSNSNGNGVEGARGDIEDRQEGKKQPKFKSLTRQKSRNARITETINKTLNTTGGGDFDITDTLGGVGGEEDVGTVPAGDEAADSAGVGTLKRKKSKKRRGLSRAPSVAQQNDQASTNYNNNVDVAKALQLDVLPDSFTTTSKFRTCYVVKNKNGEEVTVRGAPKCYPIWFVGSGDLKSNWEGLPGGEKLQAQLNVIYEKGHFEEYVGVLTTTLLDLRRQLDEDRPSEELQEFLGRLEAEIEMQNQTQAKAQSRRSTTRTGGSPTRNGGSPTRNGGSPTRNGGSPARTGGSPTREGGSPGKVRRGKPAPGGYAQYGDGGGTGSVGEEEEETDYADKLLASAEFPDIGYTGPASRGTSPAKSTRKGGENSPSRRQGTAAAGVGSPGPSTTTSSSSLMNTGQIESFSPRGEGRHTGKVTFNTETGHAELPPLDARQEAYRVLQSHWKQAVGACIALSTISTSRKTQALALKLSQLALRLCAMGDFLDRRERLQLKAYCYNAMAYYFYSCKKRTAALSHTRQASKLHSLAGNTNYVAVCLLHIACIECQMAQFKDSHAVRYI